MLKKIIFLPVLFFAMTVFSQSADTPVIQHDRPGPFSDDSIAFKLQRFRDSADKTLQDIRMQDIERNMNSLVRIQEENRRKQKRNAMIRIGLGVLGFIILVIGLRRRNTKKG